MTPAHAAADRTRAARSPEIALAPPARAPSDRRAGNQAHLRRLQAKLSIGAVDDPLEHEADAVADHVMRMPDPAPAVSAAPPNVSRKCAACEEEDKASVRREAAGPAAPGGATAPESVDRVLQSPGRPLDPVTHDFMAGRFGTDFSGVRIHTDGEAARSAGEVNAHAYTVGSHVVFGAGRYDPGGEAGRRLLAHELAHTLQQGAVAPTVRRDGPNPPDAPLKEAKAEDAKSAVAGGLKEVADKAGNDPKIKDWASDFVKRNAGRIWSGLSDTDKAGVIGAGAVVAGGAVAAGVTPQGRDALSGVPIGKPLDLIPYAIVNNFSYDLPKTKADPLQLHLSLKADDFLDLLRQKYAFMPKMSLSYEFTLTVGPDGKVAAPYGLAKFSPYPGVGLAAGYGVATDLPTMAQPPGGGPMAPVKEYPTPATPKPPAGAAAFITVDLAQIPALRPILGPVVGDFSDKK